MAKALLIAALMGVAAVAAASPYNPLLAGVVMEKSPAFDSIAARGYTMLAKTTGDVEVVFAVRQNTEAIKSVLDEVSDPANAKYGQYLTFQEVGERFMDKTAIEQVHVFLNTHGIHLNQRRSTPHGEYVTVTMTAAKANEMLQTQFYNFEHEDGTVITRAAQYSLPVEVAPFVSYVGQVTTFPNLHKKPIFHSLEPAKVAKFLRGMSANGCGSGVATPSCISMTYKIDNNTVATKAASNAVFETIQQSYKPSDLTMFDKNNNVPPQTVHKVIGPNTPSSCDSNPNNCVEAELDVQQITAIAQDTDTTFWSVPGTESFLQWAQAVASASNPPKVHSISYGEPESDGSASQQKGFDTEVQKLGTMGVTVLVASGDDGVAGSSARGNPGACGFNPSYPATAPHITAVGATQGPESGSAEVACSSSTGGGITTGGGFSNTFSQPSWQSSQVAAYLKNGPDMPPASKFNGKGRGYPDVGLMGHNYAIVVGGQTYQGSGTSASTPVFGAILTLINAKRINAGKATLGFLNKALYGLDTSVFNDITSGKNNCAAGSSGSQTCCQYGFTATSGWDPLTGFGSVDFTKFSKALEAL